MDYLQFEGGLVTIHRVGWTGPWPPPERMVLAQGVITGKITVAEPDNPNLASLEAQRLLTVRYYQRASASALLPQSEDSHVMRGALYVPEEPT